jgi:hypothetical protein
MPRLAARNSLDATKEPRSVAHGSNGSTTSTSSNTDTTSTTGTTAAGAMTRGVSSRQQLASPTAKDASAGDSSGDDAGDSH